MFLKSNMSSVCETNLPDCMRVLAVAFEDVMSRGTPNLPEKKSCGGETECWYRGK